jgi:hypothetical protein
MIINTLKTNIKQYSSIFQGETVEDDDIEQTLNSEFQVSTVHVSVIAEQT